MFEAIGGGGLLKGVVKRVQSGMIVERIAR